MQCTACHIGTLHSTRATYTRWLKKNLVIVPNVDARLCDVCGEFYYEPEAIARIEILLSGDQPSPHPIQQTNLNRGTVQPSQPSPNRGRGA